MCAIVLIGHAAYDFRTQLRGTTAVDIAEEPIPRYRPDEAEAILLYYEGRVKTFERFTNARPQPTTPLELQSGE